jgi:uncharacterized protein
MAGRFEFETTRFDRGGGMHILIAVLIGLGAGLLVGLMGIGGGVIVVPALVYLLGMDQHMAQGTSLFMLLPPLGLGALWEYWKEGEVDLRAGVICAVGFFLGGYLGGLAAVGLSSRILQAIFGSFLMFAALLLWQQARRLPESRHPDA